jgi:uncharacterized membrane protein YphA (DoxX/SURF4 family)
MSIKTFLGSKNWGMLLVRIVVGLVFIVHGWDKIQNIEGVIGFFGSLGLMSAFAYLVAWTEFLGGLAVLLGLFSKYAAYLLAIVMVGAIYLVKFKMGFAGGYEFDLLLLVSALAIAWTKDMPFKIL